MPPSSGAGPDLVLDDELGLHPAQLRDTVLHAVVDVLRSNLLDRDLPDGGRGHAEALLRGGDLLEYLQRLGVDVDRRAILLRLGLDGIDGDAHRVSEDLDLGDQIRGRLIHVARRDLPRLLRVRGALDHAKGLDEGGEDAAPLGPGRIEGQARGREQSQAAHQRRPIGSNLHLAYPPSGWSGLRVAQTMSRCPGALAPVRNDGCGRRAPWRRRDPAPGRGPRRAGRRRT